MRIVRLILRCYPKAWRARYEAEILDVAASEGASVGLVLDLLAGALDARLHPNLVPTAGERGPVIYDERTLLQSRYRRQSGLSFLGVIAWIGWTALGGMAIAMLYSLLAVVGLIPYDLRERDAEVYSTLLWLQWFGAPVMGNLIIRRLIRGAVRRRHANVPR